jgi:hypothetical protein
MSFSNAQAMILTVILTGANDDAPISAIWQYHRIEHITSRQIKNALQGAILAIGEDTLHITADETGTHSICSGVAMAMFLGECPVFLTMMIGCWSSNTFLCYSGKQVKEFDHNNSRKMITHMFTDTYPTSHPQQSLTSIPGNAIILTMLRHKETLGGTWLDKPGCLLLKKFELAL